MSFYETMQATASRLIDQFGQALTIQRASFEIYDPASGAVASMAPALMQTTGIMQRIGRDLFSNIQLGDRQMVLDGSVEPLQGDQIRVDGLLWSVVDIAPVDPAGTPLVYIVQVRR